MTQNTFNIHALTPMLYTKSSSSTGSLVALWQRRKVPVFHDSNHLLSALQNVCNDVISREECTVSSGQREVWPHSLLGAVALGSLVGQPLDGRVRTVG